MLRLAALTGAAELLPLLLQAAENEPDTGYYLLALYGQKSVIPELLKAMEIAHTLEAAATAFTELSDQTLPLIPRLTVVAKDEADDAEEADDPDEEPEQIPDIKAARAWWDKNKTKWKAEERWLTGKPATPTHLLAMSKKYAGSVGCDVMALLALAHKAPLNIAPETWRARQLQLLVEQFPATTSTQAASKPARTQHA